jgi:hypothetical protein
MSLYTSKGKKQLPPLGELDQPSTSTARTSEKDSNDEASLRQEDDEDDDDGDDVADIDVADMKLNQLRRGNRKRRKRGNQYNRLEGLQSLETLKKSHALKRMEEGLRNILALHTPVELSSICGCLQLKVQQKAATSIEQIIQFVLKTEDFDLTAIETVLGYMWEGALWEYLHRIGHPIHSTRVNPRRTVMEIWEKGGILSNGSLFAPHFIAREVKKRNEWITSPDIQQRLEQIRNAQDSAKLAEKKIIAEHDYTNILSYFKEMAKLRSLENSVREYLISELEIARSRVDSSQDTMKILREQLLENENLFIAVTEKLNVDLAGSQHVCKYNIRRRFQMEEAVYRLNNIVNSFIESENDRFTPGGGGAQATKPRHVEEFPPLMRETFEKLQTYRDLRDSHDDEMRYRSRCHIDEIHELRNKIKDLELRLDQMSSAKTLLSDGFDKLIYENALLQRKIIREEQQFKIQKDILWEQAIENTRKVSLYEQQYRKVKPFLKAAACHSHPFVQDLSLTLLKHFRLLMPDQQEYRELMESIQMKRQDVIDYFVRELQLKAKRDAERQAANASAKGKKSKSSKSSKQKESDNEKEKEKEKEKSKENEKKKGKDDDAKTVSSKSLKSPSGKPPPTPSKKSKK